MNVPRYMGKSRKHFHASYMIDPLALIRMAETGDDRKFKNDLKEISTRKRKDKLALDTKQILRKRSLRNLPKRRTDIYVINKTNFKAQLNECEKLLDADEPELIFCGLGAAINKVCNLAFRLKENHHGTIDPDIKTSTVDIIDDIEPLTNDANDKVNNRQNSAIHIRVFRKVTLGVLRYSE